MNICTHNAMNRRCLYKYLKKNDRQQKVRQKKKDDNKKKKKDKQTTSRWRKYVQFFQHL